MPVFEPEGTVRFPHLFSEIQRMLVASPGRPSQFSPPLSAIPNPITSSELAEEESRLGYVFPPLLRQLYLQVGNGGFGPGNGLLSVRQISPKVDQTIATLYHQLHGARIKRGAMWQDGLVPFAEWGDFILSCVDLSADGMIEDPPVVRYEPNMPEQATFAYLRGAPFRGAGLIPEFERLSSWFEAWLKNDEMFSRPYARY
jgi:hypothetical protein